MPGKSLFTDAAWDGPPPQPTSATPGRKVLYALDATFPPGSAACDVAELTAVSAAAVRAGGGHVLDASHVIFANGAVTLVLILAESHLAIHTWPEEDRIAIDLFSCGSIDADRVSAELTRALRLTDVRARRVDRSGGQAGIESDSPN